MRILRIILCITGVILLLTSCNLAPKDYWEYCERDTEVRLFGSMGAISFEARAEVFCEEDGGRLFRIHYSAPRGMSGVTCEGRLDRSCGFEDVKVMMEGMEVSCSEEEGRAFLAPILCLFEGGEIQRVERKEGEYRIFLKGGGELRLGEREGEWFPTYYRGELLQVNVR